MSKTMSPEGKIGRSQGNELLNKLEAAGMGSGMAQAVIGSKGNALAMALVAFLQVEIAKLMQFLHYVGAALIPANAGGEKVGDFFTTRPGLYVWSDFTNRVIGSLFANIIKPISGAHLPYYDLKDSATDFDIEKDLGDGFIFEDVEVFLSYLKSLISAQWGGKSGVLLNNGNANLFYVRVGGVVLTVHVFWDADCGLWDVYVYSRDEIRWGAGCRAFRSN